MAAQLGSPEPSVGALGASPQFTRKGFGPAQAGERTQKGGHPAA